MNNKALELATCTLESGQILDYTTVKNYLVSGNGNVTDQEVLMFIELCKAQKLNPFIKEAYLIKFGNSPANIVVG
ncbi:TPA: recombinase RecT, partial [Clostridioides difficile]|nr:recombinase RecT [Clostridioides difficile]HBF3006600.1 recombinase RecT [Clostridioides difficile]HBF9753195.1 recombinase RecT [Clostridioides difficile]HBF9753314.1 recombinase RecT [Clostridioides difficile]HBZ0274978.1 recombinase RecT [Clostridioides difficile]